MSVVLNIDNISKKIGQRQIIKNLSLETNAGEVFGFLGPNGAGKTTTIRMIGGLSSITSGEISVCGKCVQTNFEEALLNVGAIIEEPQLYRYMSGYDNLKYFASLYKGITKADIDNMVERFGMSQRINTKVKTYSLGMRQRLGLIQALLHKPKLLILDEPTNGLDPSGIHELRVFLRKLAAEEGVSVFVSSHILSEMQQMCDRVGIINQGTLISVNDISEINAMSASTSKTQIQVDDTIKAAQILKEKMDVNVEINGSHVDILIDRIEVPRAVNALVAGEIAIYAIDNNASSSLENMYIKLTEGTEIE